MNALKHPWVSVVATATLVVLFYLVCFVLLTWPAMHNFNTHVFAGPNDGLQMYWNVWWIRHAVLETWTNPFITSLLYYPESPNLLTHSLHSFGGFMGIPLGVFLNDVAVFNAIVAFAFALSGWGAYELSKEFVGKGLPALIGGYIFTFSNYHFAHAQGHLNLVLMQWIPFYVLYLYRLVTVGRMRHAVIAATFLFLVLLCDHYYFVFCLLITLIFGLWALVYKRSEVLNHQMFKRFLAFSLAIALSSGVFVVQFLKVAMHNEGMAGHNAARFGMDFFALLIPGGHWRFYEITAPYWQRLSGGIHGGSVHVGLAVLILAGCGYSLLKQRRDNLRFLFLWIFIAFFALSLGTDLQVFGIHLQFPMPYEGLVWLLPPLRGGGVPNRFIVISILMVSVLAAYGAQRLSRSPRGTAALVALLVFAFVELLPRPIPNTSAASPRYVERFSEHTKEEPGALLDLVNTPSRAMFFQTQHKQPIQTGYLARVQRSVQACADQIDSLAKAGQFKELRRRWGFRYVFSKTPIQHGELLFRDADIKVYEILPPPVPDGEASRPRVACPM